MFLAKRPRFLRLECELHLHSFQTAWSLLQTTASSTKATAMLFQRRANTPAKPTRKYQKPFWTLLLAQLPKKDALSFVLSSCYSENHFGLCLSLTSRFLKTDTLYFASSSGSWRKHDAEGTHFALASCSCFAEQVSLHFWTLLQPQFAEEGHLDLCIVVQFVKKKRCWRRTLWASSKLKVFAEDRHFVLCIVVQFVKKKRYWRRTLGASSNLTDLLKTITLFFASSSFLQRKNVAEGGHLDQGSNLKVLLKRDTLIFASPSCLWRKNATEGRRLDRCSNLQVLYWRETLWSQHRPHVCEEKSLLKTDTLSFAKPQAELKTDTWS